MIVLLDKGGGSNTPQPVMAIEIAASPHSHFRLPVPLMNFAAFAAP